MGSCLALPKVTCLIETTSGHRRSTDCHGTIPAFQRELRIEARFIKCDLRLMVRRGYEQSTSKARLPRTSSLAR